MKTNFRTAGLAILCAGAVSAFSGAAQAITLLQPGYTDNAVANLSQQNPFGSMALDAAGNIYLTESFSASITRITPGGLVSTFLTVPGTNSLALERVGNTLYAGNQLGQVYSIDLTNPTPAATFLGTASGAINGLAFAPGSFGAYAGNLIVATNTGLQSMSVSSGALTGFTLGGTYSDVVFDGSDRLIAANYGSGIQNVSSAGTVLSTINVNSGFDGLAVSASTGNIYAANSGGLPGQIIEIDGTTLTTSSFASGAGFDSGYYPAAIAFSNDGGSLYYYERDFSNNRNEVNRIDGFPTVSQVPEPGMAALFGLGLAAFGFARRRRA
jgi:DNA-binding beta-propeller fold protein YncE